MKTTLVVVGYFWGWRGGGEGMGKVNLKKKEIRALCSRVELNGNVSNGDMLEIGQQNSKCTSTGKGQILQREIMRGIVCEQGWISN